MEQVLAFLNTNKEALTLLVAIAGIVSTTISGFIAVALRAIAIVNEIFLAGADMTNEQALQKASDIAGKYVPFIPEVVRKWLLQIVFDSMKRTFNKEVKN